jgi:hypothetical protein
MAATIIRISGPSESETREQRLMELVRDLSGATTPAAEAAFHQAPPSPAEPLERVAHALVQLRHTGSLRIAAYVPPVQTRPAATADIVPLPTLHEGPSWAGGLRGQLVRSRSRSATTDSMQPTGSSKA